MFQPQPTPFASSCFNSYGVPDIFSFAPDRLTLQNPSNLSNFSGAPPPSSQSQTGRGSGSVNGSSSAQDDNPNSTSHHSLSHHHGPGHGSHNPTSRTHQNVHGGLGRTDAGRGNNHSHSTLPLHTVHAHHQQRNHQHHHRNQHLGLHQRNQVPQSHPHPHPQTQALLYGSPSHTSSPSTSPATSTQGHFAYNTSIMDQSDAQALQDELAAQEAAAREYQPQLEGPLVGDKTPSTAITNEYAKADPIYVEKTLALPNTYTHYRPIQGDGNCGWRAIGFSYFEALIEAGDRVQVETEIARIISLNQVLNSVGYQECVFEAMADETLSLLKEICGKMGNRDAAMDALTTRFNNRECSNGIIYHLRLLAGSWLKTNPSLYEPFVQEFGVAGYCSDVIERVDREIEHVGIMLLYNVLLKPANIVLEIAYLDRSAGSQVNVYRFPDSASGESMSPLAPVIYLLYRPDHYDILYKGINIQVNRVTVFNQHAAISQQHPLDAFSSVDFAALSAVPGLMTTAETGLSSLVPPTGPPPPQPVMAPEPYVSSHPQVPWDIQTQFDHAMTPQPMQTPTTTPLAPPPPPPPPPPQPQPQPEAPTSPPATTYTLRFSEQYYQLDNTAFPEPNFTTTMFKNSHFNKAHYNNPDFHPEEWTPDDESQEKAPGGKKKSRGKHE